MNITHIIALIDQREREDRFASALQSAARETVSAPDFADLEAAALTYGPDSFIAEQVAFFHRLAGR